MTSLPRVLKQVNLCNVLDRVLPPPPPLYQHAHLPLDTGLKLMRLPPLADPGVIQFSLLPQLAGKSRRPPFRGESGPRLRLRLEWMMVC